MWVLFFIIIPYYEILKKLKHVQNSTCVTDDWYKVRFADVCIILTPW